MATNKKVESKSFAEQLARRMKFKGLHHVEFDQLSDGSCQYIDVIKDGYELSIQFDGKGEFVTDISLVKQIRAIVDYENIWKV